jgi:hypothetical protein
MLTLFLSSLLDDVEGGRTNTALAEWGEAYGFSSLVDEAMVTSLDASRLESGARKARAIGKPMTAEWLELLAEDWPQISAAVLTPD